MGIRKILDFKPWKLSEFDGKWWREGAFICYAGKIFILSLSIVYLFYNRIWMILGYPLMIPFLMERFRHRKKVMDEINLLVQFRDFLYSLSVSVASGRQMGQGWVEAEAYMATLYDENSIFRVELSHMIYRFQEAREPEDQILMDLSLKYPLEDMKTFAEVYRICRSTGGDLEKSILTTIQVLLDKMEIQQEFNALTAQKKYEAKIIAVIPFFMLALLRFASPGYLNILYNSLEGFLLMTLAISLILGSFLWMTKLLEVRI